MLTGVRRRFGCAPEADDKAFTTEDTGVTEKGLNGSTARWYLSAENRFRNWLYYSSSLSSVTSLSSVSPVSSVVENLEP